MSRIGRDLSKFYNLNKFNPIKKKIRLSNVSAKNTKVHMKRYSASFIIRKIQI